jgi:hypothetical protein
MVSQVHSVCQVFLLALDIRLVPDADPLLPVLRFTSRSGE